MTWKLWTKVLEPDPQLNIRIHFLGQLLPIYLQNTQRKLWWFFLAKTGSDLRIVDPSYYL